MNEKQSTRQVYLATMSLFVGLFGSSIFSFAVGLYLLKVYTSASIFGISQVIGPLATLLMAPVIRIFIDRYPKKKIIAATQFFNIVVLLGFAAVISLNIQHIFLIAVFALLMLLSLASQVFNVAYMSSATALVLKKDIQKMRSYEQMVSSLSTIVSPIMGAALYAVFSTNFDAYVLVQLATEVLTLLLMWRLKYQNLDIHSDTETQQEIEAEPVKQNELQFIWQDKILLAVIILGCVLNFFFAAFNVGIPYLQVHVLQLPSQVYAVSEAAVSIGVLLANVYLAKRKAFRHPIDMTWKISLGMSSLFFVLAGVLWLQLTNQIAFSIFIIIFNLVMGTLIAIMNTPILVWLTQRVPDELQGRVFNVFRTGVQIMTPLGVLICSLAFDYFQPKEVFFLVGVICLLFVLALPRVFGVNFKEDTV
ncbi:MFS transporter [Fructobacillus ficulneus]|uniref:Transporter, major facilitator family protein n=1 Tax=Fructobacillus ficulneus TaxID=157463 RepID=A0A0K8MIB8_9LACO|nr:MFS transporter [Fructobacillus ficulneus]GAO99609.1 transporter, major facilitator family protein [Fructobacillus ficulneus]